MIARARLHYWAALVAVLFAVVTTKARAEPPKLEPFLTYSHTSDVLTGFPFGAQPPGCEPTTDFLGAGVSIVWKRAEVDLAHGIKARDFWCGKPHAKSGESGTMLTVRWYPWRR